jgi:hypothetical protein
MKPKEKAVELYSKYEQLGKDFTRGVSMKEFSKECALIAVDEIINGYEFDSLDIEHNRIMDNINFWDEVKQEIERL